MLKHSTQAWGLALALAASACSDDDKPTNSGNGDDDAGADSSVDATRMDAARPDSSTPLDGAGGTPDGAASEGEDAATTADAGPLDSGGAILACDATKAPAVPPLKLEAVPGVGTLDKLVDAEQPKGTADWYLVQQTGIVRVLRDGALLNGNFVDVRDQIALRDDGDERGLLGIAFPPDYVASGRFYIAVTATKAPNTQRDTVYEYQRSPDGLSSVATGKVVVQLPASDSNHNGGNLQFGPDGFLYFGTGDGGGGCNSDEPGAPQDPTSPFGKILRLDPQAAAPFAAAGNPFSGDAGDPTVLHYGLRNPFRFGFDRATGDMFIGDVGQDSFEEVNFAAADAKGLNFGWPVFEGDHDAPCPANNTVLNPGSIYTKPIVDLPQNTGIWSDYISVIGGVVYRGAAIAELQGVYLFGDYQGARMGAIYQCGDKTSPPTQIAKNKDPNQPTQVGFSRPSEFRFLTAIVEDNANELYFVVNRSTLWKIVRGT